MVQAVIHNGEGYWNGRAWSQYRDRAVVFPTLKSAKETSKTCGGWPLRVEHITLEGESRTRTVERIVEKPLDFAFVVWRHTSLDPGHMLGCFDKFEEADQRAREEMHEITSRIMGGKFVNVSCNEPYCDLWHNKWDDHIGILKLPVQ